MIIKRLRLFLPLCVLCLGSVLSVRAQQKLITQDSLEQLLETSRNHYYDYDYQGALETTTSLIDLAEADKNNYYTFRGYDLMGQVYFALKDTTKSRLIRERALVEAKSSEVDSLISWALSSLGNAYAEDPNLYKTGVNYYEQAIAFNEKSGAPEAGNLVPLMNIGWTLLDHNKNQEAYPYLLRARKLSQLENQSPILHMNLDILFGRYYLDNQNYALAEDTFRKAIDISEQNNFLDQASDAALYLSRTYEEQERFEEALTENKRLQGIQERIYAKEKLSALEEASAKFEVQQYQKDLQLAKREQDYATSRISRSRRTNIILIIASLILLILLLSIYKLFKQRQKVAADLKVNNLELQKSKEEAERLSKLKTQFFSTVSHELRTPLYGVTGIASILLEDKEIKTHREDLKSLKFSADYLMTLINDVLIMNKMDANGVKLEKAPFKLATLVNSIAKSFEYLIQQNNNKLHIQIDQRLPEYLNADSVRLSQILLNLVGNAVKFNENGNIWLTIQLQKELPANRYAVHFEVRDDGRGIAAEDQEKIFEEFSQVNNRNYNYQGTGLGLPIVKKLLHLFGSEIHLESALGKGSNFNFTLEVAASTAPSVPTAQDPERIKNEFVAIAHPEDIHILIVDDNRINQKVTQKVLQSRHFNCSQADNGQQAVDLVKENAYDLILMDIHMPVMNGIEATKEIRKFNTITPIIALTAVEVEEMRKSIIESGMNDIILKPYDVLQFQSTILRNLKEVVKS